MFDTTLAPFSLLAITAVEVVIYGVAAMLFVGSMITNAKKDKDKKEKGRPRRANLDVGSSQGRPSLDEIAARRRQQLQELARQRRGGSSPPTQVRAAADSGNLSMADRIARARARQQGSPQPASSGLTSAGSNAPLPSAASSHPAARSTQTPAARNTARQERTESLRQRFEQRQQQQREALARRQQQTQQAKAQRAQAKAQSRAQRAPTPKITRAAPQSQRPAAAPEHGITDASPHKDVHRMVHNAPEQRFEHADRHQAKKTAPLLNFKRLSKTDLRRAFILKEVLNKPVAEQDPLADIHNG